MSSVALCSERPSHHWRSEKRGGFGRHVVLCGISMWILWGGSRRSLPSSKDRFATKHIRIEEPVGRNGGQKTLKIEHFADGWLTTGSYLVQLNCTASRKHLQGLPGLQDFKNRQKTTKNVKNDKNMIFVAVFLAVFFL